MSTDTALITAQEFADISAEMDGLCELVRGEIREITRPTARHGGICMNIGATLWNWAWPTRRGRVVSNDAGVRTERDPDTVRGPDLYYIREDRLPGGQYPQVWLEIPPDLCVEVLSPSDRWKDVLDKVTEYLEFGVLEVWVADPDSQRLHVYRPDSEPLILAGDDEAHSPNFPEFRVPVRRFFDGC